ncbi:peptidase A2 domain-containing protein [Trichonephila inaurata madagascariensis]|uniref:Peptidase A2 domain-containing protein n=1 Tax=Trichonephila inaurata madagascariensis TaxID=2747483 RepID=A0A8X6Y9S4_9ARAC|nr:peptidase A2 domain-containing protein [Trichonephila inaurata madagascariensis]
MHSRLPLISEAIRRIPIPADNHSADYSVISEELRRQLNVPMFDETGLALKTACGKPVATSGRCVLKIVEILQLAETFPNTSSNESDFSLSAATDYLIEPNSSKQICALNTDIQDVNEALIIGNKDPMCERELSIPASIVNIESGCCKVWITNFSHRIQLIPKGINVACLTTIEKDAICSLKNEDRSGSQGRKARTRITREKLGLLDVELTLRRNNC